MVGFQGGAQIRESGRGGGQAVNQQIHKEIYIIRKMVGFTEGAQIWESGRGGAQAGNQQIHKESYKENGRVPGGRPD